MMGIILVCIAIFCSVCRKLYLYVLCASAMFCCVCSTVVAFSCSDYLPDIVTACLRHRDIGTAYINNTATWL